MQYEATSLALGARGGILIVSMPAALNTASTAVVNLASRSRTRNRNRVGVFVEVHRRLRAAWPTHAPVGRAVIPARCTRRRSSFWLRRNAASRTLTMWLRGPIRPLPFARARDSNPGGASPP